MPDREKVIKGLEYCMGGCQVSCFKCPYRDPGEVSPDCLDNCRILQDAVELLKEQRNELSTAYYWGRLPSVTYIKAVKCDDNINMP